MTPKNSFLNCLRKINTSIYVILTLPKENHETNVSTYLELIKQGRDKKGI